MMEIPAADNCSLCAFWHSQVNDFYEREDICTNRMFADEEGVVTLGFRTSACLTAYPNGAVITITAKEKG